MFSPCRLLQPNLMFVGKAGAYPKVKHLKSAPLQSRLLALRANIRLGWKDLLGANALAY
jgi:hypothetical protein